MNKLASQSNIAIPFQNVKAYPFLGTP